jgi:hypothetical protein
MVRHASAVETLLPPNFMTTQDEVEISGPDPSITPSSNSASSIGLVITWHSLALSYYPG